ncbi:alpha-L-rhamnosidase [Xaviernesmea oryzae]|uniref:alpha-L-rhamnosidase n=1 Tax=Xaviernesmea oryzae TaxID=464029 RepID=A0A1Q9AR43_9HYPH|nr:alpha-L-rhamnosidase [Xaviernesmea oryzae]OLP57907.1 alpha-L-rhamnosidase [Xaviernesmea oryzae]SEL31375.1 alpha-L-rhamnosidase [Xaviernesmea oryzae]
MNMHANRTRIAAARDWAARMIAPLADQGVGSPASFVATAFSVTEPAGEAQLFISAQGLYRCFINGIRVGQDLLTPGLTNYDDRIAFQRYAVGPLLHEGENRIEIWLADGWFRSQIMWGANAISNCWGDRIAAIAEIVSGPSVLVKTDEAWQSGTLPIRQSGIYFGETYDARIAPGQVSHGVEVLPFDIRLLVPHETAPVRVLEAIAPVDRWQEAGSGATIYDFGQNVGGFVRFTVTGEAGAEVLIEHSEVLGPQRAFDNRNYRTAKASLRYILAGGGPETYEPMFTFQGFRYARVTIKGQARIEAIHAVAISSLAELKGGFSTGSELVNRLVLNTIWSQRANFIEIPTDCPQRDERLGWTGDAQVFAPTACWLADCQSFLRKYLRDVMADQRPDGAIPHVSPDPTRLHPEHFPGFAGSTGWGDAIVLIPWTLYLHYGDKAILSECLDAMIRWVDFVWSISDGPIVRPPANWGERGFTFGDWLQPVGDNRKPRPTIGDDCAATLYHFISTNHLARIAGLCGRPEVEARMTARAAEIWTAFAHEFITPAGRLAHHDQTSYALAFLHDLVPEQHAEAAKAHFRRTVEDADFKIGTGFIGTPALLPALSKLGLDELAEKVFLQEEVPGWLYQVKQGATSIWERWDAIAPDGTIYDPDMNSYNHYAYGAVCQWLFESVAGIKPDPQKPGFARVIVSPGPLRGLNPVSAWHESPRGRIAVDWSIEGDEVRYRLVLPQGSEGIFAPSPRLGPALADGQPLAPGAILAAGAHDIRFSLRDEAPGRAG